MSQDLPEGKGKDLVQDICVNCHDLDVVTSERATRQGWTSLLNQMVTRGAVASPEEIQIMVDYLAKNFPKLNINKATAKEIEAGLDLSAKEAEAVVKYRQQHGDFKTWPDLTKIDGVDPKKLEAKKDRIVFN